MEKEKKHSKVQGKEIIARATIELLIFTQFTASTAQTEVKNVWFCLCECMSIIFFAFGSRTQLGKNFI